MIDNTEWVNGPTHYGGADNPYEVIKVCEAWGLDKDAYLFNVVKYVARAGKKNVEKEIKLNAQDLLTEIEGCIECVEVDGDAKPAPCRVIIAPPCMPTESGATELRTSATVTWLADAELGFAKP